MILNLENEIWTDIEGYKDLYEISNMGRIKSYPRIKGCIYFEEQLLNQHNNKPNKNEKGYLYVNLYNDGVRKRFYVHRLVADAFIENPNNYAIMRKV